MKRLLVVVFLSVTLFSCSKNEDTARFWIELDSQCEEYEEGITYEVSRETWYNVKELDLHDCDTVAFTTLEGERVSGYIGVMSRAGN